MMASEAQIHHHWTRTEKGRWWIDPPEGSLPFEFCRDTSLHGLKYIEQPRRHLTERIFWLLAFLVGLIIAVKLIVDVWSSFRDNPIIVTFAQSETTVDEIPFPAVTICNMNKVKKSKAEQIMRTYNEVDFTSEEFQQAYDDLYMLEHVCRVSSGFSKTFGFSLHQGSVREDLLTKNEMAEETQSLIVDEFLQKNSQKCTQMIPLCQWQNDVVDCSALFNPIETSFGKCCTFNMVPQTLFHRFRNDSRDNPEEVAEWSKWNPEEDGFIFSGDKDKHLKFPRRQRRAGKTYGLSILLDPDLEEYFCTTSDAIGFRAAVHLSTDIPQVTDFGIAIGTNREVFVNVRPEITMAEDSIHGFPLNKRLCYFPRDYPLQYHKYYTASNCVNEVIARETLKNCSCVRYYMPRDDSTPLCGPQEAACAEATRKKFAQDDLASSNTNCYPLCTEIHYTATETSTRLQYSEDNWLFPNQSYARWKHNNVSIVHIFFGEPSTYARVRKQFLSNVDLIAQTGGIMGLCLGFSGLSLIEFIYYFTIRLWWQTKWQEHFGSKVLQTVAGAWHKTRTLAHLNGGLPATIPGWRRGPKDHMEEAPAGGGIKWNRREIFHHMTRAWASKEMVSEAETENGLSKRKEDDRGDSAVIFGEIAPYYSSSPNSETFKSQYWNLRA